MVGERWCVKDGVCDTVVCERWCVKMVCGEVPHGQPSATSATPATQMKGQCHQMPHLPRKWKAKRHACHANGTKCHAGHARWRSAPRDQARPSAPPEPAQCHKCHACHANGRSMSPSATCATQSGAAPRPVPQVPRLPRKWKVNVTKDGV